MTRAGVRRCWLAACFALQALVFAQAQAQRAPQPDWEADIRHFEQLDAAHPPAAGGIVFVGSSSIRKWTTLAEDFVGLNVINRGFGGSKIPDSTRYAARIVTKYKPHTVVLYAGDNDIADGAGAQQVAADFAAFVSAVRRDLPHARIVFVSVKPSPSRESLIGTTRAANALVQAAVRRDRDLRYVDVFTPMLDANGRPRAELFVEDGLHMNAQGYALWTAAIRPVLDAN